MLRMACSSRLRGRTARASDIRSSAKVRPRPAARAAPRSGRRIAQGVRRSNMSRIVSINAVSACRAGCTIGCTHSRAIARMPFSRASASSARRSARSPVPRAPSGRARQPVSSNASRSTRAGARRTISSATRPPIEWPASANVGGASRSTLFRHRNEAVLVGILGDAAPRHGLQLRKNMRPDSAIAEQAGQEQQFHDGRARLSQARFAVALTARADFDPRRPNTRRALPSNIWWRSAAESASI